MSEGLVYSRIIDEFLSAVNMEPVTIPLLYGKSTVFVVAEFWSGEDIVVGQTSVSPGIYPRQVSGIGMKLRPVVILYCVVIEDSFLFIDDVTRSHSGELIMNMLH